MVSPKALVVLGIRDRELLGGELWGDSHFNDLLIHVLATVCDEWVEDNVGEGEEAVSGK